jgi:hypothetical protein
MAKRYGETRGKYMREWKRRKREDGSGVSTNDGLYHIIIACGSLMLLVEFIY